MGRTAARARRRTIGKTIPKGLTVRDLEMGYLTKRFSYAYCSVCGNVVDGWPSAGGWRASNKCRRCDEGELKNSWLEVNWRILVDMLEIAKKHDLPGWYGGMGDE